MPAQTFIGKSTGTTLHWQAEWQHWRRKGWCRLTLSLGRTGESEVEAVDGLSVRLAQAMSHYQRAMGTVQLVPGDMVLMKNDTYQGKWKVKDWWSEAEYVVVCQVTDGIPAYEVKDETGNVKTIHHNQLFLVAIPVETVMPLGGRHISFRGKHHLVHPCGSYLIWGKERFTRGICGRG